MSVGGAAIGWREIVRLTYILAEEAMSDAGACLFVVRLPGALAVCTHVGGWVVVGMDEGADTS